MEKEKRIHTYWRTVPLPSSVYNARERTRLQDTAAIVFLFSPHAETDDEISEWTTSTENELNPTFRFLPFFSIQFACK